MPPTRIFLADDNAVLLAELCHELEKEFGIIGTATNGQVAAPALEDFVSDNSRSR